MKLAEALIRRKALKENLEQLASRNQGRPAMPRSLGLQLQGYGVTHTYVG